MAPAPGSSSPAPLPPCCAFIPSTSLLHGAHPSHLAASAPRVRGCHVGLWPGVLGQSNQCHLGGELDGSSREGSTARGHAGLGTSGEPHRDCARGRRLSPWVPLASHAPTAAGGKRASRAARSTGSTAARCHSKQTPWPLHPALLCQCGFQVWATGWSRASPDPAEPCLVM